MLSLSECGARKIFSGIGITFFSKKCLTKWTKLRMFVFKFMDSVYEARVREELEQSKKQPQTLLISHGKASLTTLIYALFMR